MNQRQKIDIFKQALYEMYPDAETELDFENEFQLLVAIIMSAQTTDKQVNKVNQTFFQHLKSPADGVKMGEEGIRNHIRAVNFFNNKAKNIFKTCEILSHSPIPRSIEELTKLPGVGIKTAKVFLGVADNAPYLGVDTHVHRVLNRVGFVKTKTPLETDAKVAKVFTTDDLAKLHHTLILFGRYHCIARKPKCGDCPVKDICNYKNKNI
ncbi:endonuclease III [Candidatus Gracilibacteria bacterium]|nr:endonuclease III [Candidatus Gracilibacteria bacterium]